MEQLENMTDDPCDKTVSSNLFLRGCWCFLSFFGPMGLKALDHLTFATGRIFRKPISAYPWKNTAF